MSPTTPNMELIESQIRNLRLDPFAENSVKKIVEEVTGQKFFAPLKIGQIRRIHRTECFIFKDHDGSWSNLILDEGDYRVGSYKGECLSKFDLIRTLNTTF